MCIQKLITHNSILITQMDFDKMNGLVPAIIQDDVTSKVLMLGYMNKEAYELTLETGKVTFFSRTKNRLWTKGEESGNFLHVVSIKPDCDEDTLLIKVNPVGPVCHTGTDTCWGEKNEEDILFLKQLQDFIDKRYQEMPEKSYTTSLFQSGVNRMAQKVGEEAVEMIIEATNGTDERMIYEGSDMIYHLIVLLTSKGYRVEDLVKELKIRHSDSWKKH
ncbi:bifunctional phosphoribosyl-AMP cyclohydrolase/phosphoribosyl-ATP diphosphatase HisIE [Bacteroides sp. OttesenSCG-928-E20]|nr:bifunctional phosphoribosyl-AMP cyclohydrolase/phosphoribosyl-ATP diphosphatase HisIE [Bacteroides sp. OttesenSCG-928-N06]MDL2299299.1 bifunctional phosphoribosyl-AMP cyclohydrolase/phosphoribosyl-ATP diphosphatase HisIE [Bacteroides sp. OttesenSCG-928-E20]